MRVKTRTSRVNWMTGKGRRVALYSIFSCSFLWKHTGRIETTARTASMAKEYQDTASPAVVSLYSVVPAFIATKDGGATPEKETRTHWGIKPVQNAIHNHQLDFFTPFIKYVCVAWALLLSAPVWQHNIKNGPIFLHRLELLLVIHISKLC